jgi:hypothetical protein
MIDREEAIGIDTKVTEGVGHNPSDCIHASFLNTILHFSVTCLLQVKEDSVQL